MRASRCRDPARRGASPANHDPSPATYRGANPHNLHLRGYKEVGTTTTPFDRVMLNDMDRYHLVMDVIDRVQGLGSRYTHLRQAMVDAHLRARTHTRNHGDDLPEVTDWPSPHQPVS